MHLREIRSFRKLTGEGVTLVGTDLERLLEEVLPARFGGSALDYQFAEEEDEGGFTRLTLRVAPEISLGDEAGAVDYVLAHLPDSLGGQGLVHTTWREAGTIRIRRERPTMTTRGKLLPLDILRKAT